MTERAERRDEMKLVIEYFRLDRVLQAGGIIRAVDFSLVCRSSMVERQ